MKSLAVWATLSACVLSIAQAKAWEMPFGALIPVAMAETPAPGDRNLPDILRRVQDAWFKREWNDYKSRFVSPDGRVVDNANGDVSHSEGQGYGMLLATIANDPEVFQSLWAWTKQRLLVRPDGLAAWKWDPKSKAVADRNNATDGDLLIAWALKRAADRFDRGDYREASKRIAIAIGANAVSTNKTEALLLPGAFGFTAADQRDGPVVNLSYYVFPALEALKAVAPSVDWEAVKAGGRKLIDDSRFGPLHLPSDWVALGGEAPRPASSFPQTFGYDAIRIPLYLAWDGNAEAGRARFTGLWNERLNQGPFVTDSNSGAALRPIEGTGFKMIAALSACVARGRAVPTKLLATRDDFYYPATMRLLSLAVLQERYSQCL